LAVAQVAPFGLTFSSEAQQEPFLRQS